MPLRLTDDPIIPMPGEVTSHGFASQLRTLAIDLDRIRSPSWSAMITLFAALDVLMTVLAIALGAFTVAFATHHPYWSQRLAIANTIVNGFLALFKGGARDCRPVILSVSLKVFLRLLGTGTPASFLDIDYRAKEVRYELADLCAQCSRVYSSGDGDNADESDDVHRQHVEAFEALRSKHMALRADLTRVASMAFAG